jgi:hypothetical protein
MENKTSLNWYKKIETPHKRNGTEFDVVCLWIISVIFFTMHELIIPTHYKSFVTFIKQSLNRELGLWWLTPLSTIFQLYRGRQI